MCSGTKTICQSCGEEKMNFNDICSAADAPSYGIPHRILGLTEHIDKCHACFLAEQLAEELAEEEALERREDETPRAKAVLEYLNGERSPPWTTPVSFAEWARQHPGNRLWIDDGLQQELATYIHYELKPMNSQVNQRSLEFVCLYATCTFVIYWTIAAFTYPPLLGTYSTKPLINNFSYSGNVYRRFYARLRYYDDWLAANHGEFAAADLANFQAECRAAFGQLRSLLTETQAAEPRKPLSFGQWVVLKLPTRRTNQWLYSTFKSKMALELAAYTAYLTSAGWSDAAATFRLQAVKMMSVDWAPKLEDLSQ